MPRKIRELEADLMRAGFKKKSGKGSHRKFVCGRVKVNLSGQSGNDAQEYQEQQVAAAIRKSGE